MTPTAHAAAKETEVAAAVTTAKASSGSMRSEVRQSTAVADVTIAADDTATETPMRASMYDAGNVTAAAAAADTIDSVTVVPDIHTSKHRLSLLTSGPIYKISYDNPTTDYRTIMPNL